MGVGVGAGVGVGVGVRVGSGVGVGVGIGKGVAVGVGNGVGASVAVGFGLAVGMGVDVGVVAGSGVATTTTTLGSHPAAESMMYKRNTRISRFMLSPRNEANSNKNWPEIQNCLARVVTRQRQRHTSYTTMPRVITRTAFPVRIRS